jgi:hypothetical protein
MKLAVLSQVRTCPICDRTIKGPGINLLQHLEKHKREEEAALNDETIFDRKYEARLNLLADLHNVEVKKC